MIPFALYSRGRTYHTAPIHFKVLLVQTDEYHRNDALGHRSPVLKSTHVKPKRLLYPYAHSKLSNILQHIYPRKSTPFSIAS